jgi:hypothetical protein
VAHCRFTMEIEVDIVHYWLLAMGWEKRDSTPNGSYYKICSLECCYSKPHEHCLGLHDAMDREFNHQIYIAEQAKNGG